ncbi:MAG TPA: thaumatin family protein [Vicinamibacteria bacterium]
MRARSVVVCALGAAVLLPAATARAARTIVVRNSCNQTIWPGIFQQELPPGVPQPLNGGWELGPGQSTTLTLPDGFAGRIWARKNCSFNAAGAGSCESGDCFNGLRCNGLVGRAGTSLAEFTLWRPSNPGPFPDDWYDVSYVDGYDFPVKISANVASYRAPSCSRDVIPTCPAAQQVRNAAGVVVQCLSACTRYGTDPSVSPDLQKIYCCLPPFNAENRCSPAQYPNPPGNLNAAFKSACPDSYSWPLDDPTSVWHYPGNNNAVFTVTFCPDGVQTTGGGGGAPPAPPSSSVEAESGVRTGAARLASCAACSGGQKVGFIGNGSGNAVSLNVAVATGGSRTMNIHYLVNGTRTLFYSVNGRAGVALSLSGTSFSTVAPPRAVAVNLGAGNNTIRFFNNSAFAPDLDRITLTAAPAPTPIPTPTPTPTPPPGQEFTPSVASLGPTQAQIRFAPIGFSAGFVIVHYLVNGANQQNLFMAFNAGAGRWEQPVSGLGAGATVTYSFTYQKAGLEYTSGWFQYTHTPSP